MATIVRRKSKEHKPKGLDTLLLEGGFVTKEQLEGASQIARQSNKDLRQVLLEQNLVSQETLAMVLSFQFNVPRVIARVNEPRNAWLFTPEMGVDVAVNQADILGSLIQEEMSMGDMMTLLKLHRGDYSVVEEKIPEGFKTYREKVYMS